VLPLKSCIVFDGARPWLWVVTVTPTTTSYPATAEDGKPVIEVVVAALLKEIGRAGEVLAL
jgi:hypothetical protein